MSDQKFAKADYWNARTSLLLVVSVELGFHPLPLRLGLLVALPDAPACDELADHWKVVRQQAAALHAHRISDRWSPQEKRKTVAKHTHALMQDSRVGIRLTQQQKKPPPPGSEPSLIHSSTSEYALGPQHEAWHLVLSPASSFQQRGTATSLLESV